MDDTTKPLPPTLMSDELVKLTAEKVDNSSVIAGVSIRAWVTLMLVGTV